MHPPKTICAYLLQSKKVFAIILLNMRDKRKILGIRTLALFGAVVGIFLVGGVMFTVFGDFFSGLLYQPNRVGASFGEAQYSLFRVEHLISIGVAVVILVIVGFFSIGKKKYINAVLVVVGTLIVICNATLIIWSLVTRTYNVEWYLPFHICSIFFILIPLCAIFKKKVRAFLMDYLVIAGFIGWAVATALPLTSMVFYPTLHIVSICSWIHHLLMAMLSVYLVFSGNYRKYNWFNIISIIAVLLVTSATVNQLFGTNFIVMNNARLEFPMTVLNSVLGDFFVWIILVVVTCLAFGAQIAFNIYEYIKHVTVRNVLLWMIAKLNVDEKHEALLYIQRKLRIIFTAEITEFISNTSIENFTDIDYMYTHLKELGLFKHLVKKLTLITKISLSSELESVKLASSSQL